MSYNYENNPPIGIDFGTSNSAIARFVNSKRQVGSEIYYLNSQGSTVDPHLLPSTLISWNYRNASNRLLTVL